MLSIRGPLNILAFVFSSYLALCLYGYVFLSPPLVAMSYRVGLIEAEPDGTERFRATGTAMPGRPMAVEHAAVEASEIDQYRGYASYQRRRIVGDCYSGEVETAPGYGILGVDALVLMVQVPETAIPSWRCFFQSCRYWVAPWNALHRIWPLEVCQPPVRFTMLAPEVGA